MPLLPSTLGDRNILGLPPRTVASDQNFVEPLWGKHFSVWQFFFQFTWLSSDISLLAVAKTQSEAFACILAWSSVQVVNVIILENKIILVSRQYLMIFSTQYRPKQ